MKESLRLLIQKIPKLPTLPAVAQEVIKVASDDTSSIEKLSDIVKKDPTISAKVLSLSNSAFYSMGTPITSIDKAILRIGFNNVKNIAIAVSLLTLLKDFKKYKVINPKNIYKHSLAVGFVSKIIADNIERTISNEVFTAGLIHDLGYLLFCGYMGEVYSQVVRTAIERNVSIVEAESEILNCTHAEAGAWLAEKWCLPEVFFYTILYHHDPLRAKKHSKAVKIVHLSNCFVTNNLYRVIDNEVSYTPSEGIYETLNLTAEGFYKMASTIDRSFIENELRS